MEAEDHHCFFAAWGWRALPAAGGKRRSFPWKGPRNSTGAFYRAASAPVVFVRNSWLAPVKQIRPKGLENFLDNQGTKHLFGSALGLAQPSTNAKRDLAPAAEQSGELGQRPALKATHQHMEEHVQNPQLYDTKIK